MQQSHALGYKSDTAEPSDEIKYDFHMKLRDNGQELSPLSIDTLQINVTRLCNQACVHCHVDASPRRTEQMDIRTANRCLEILRDHEQIKNLDITGGAPELNPHFEHLVREAVKLGKHVMVRHNLTVTIDGNPVTGESKSHLPSFYAEHGVEVISSLPYYQEYFTDKQRGKGVFEKSIQSIKMLNSTGYGKEATGLILDFIYNPVGAFLPAPQKNLEADFKRELHKKYGIVFNNLYTITNMPINRFKQQLKKIGAYDEYMTRLVNAYNPAAAEGVMCRSLVSVGYDGRIYDCDFNQMLDLTLTGKGRPLTVFDFDYESLVRRKIIFGSHCFGCTAGSGSSCGGATA